MRNSRKLNINDIDNLYKNLILRHQFDLTDPNLVEESDSAWFNYKCIYFIIVFIFILYFFMFLKFQVLTSFDLEYAKKKNQNYSIAYSQNSQIFFGFIMTLYLF